MPIYEYETIPAAAGRKPKRFEFRQSMRDEPLRSHPETGEPVRRVISGGFEIMKSGASSAPASPAPAGGGCCGGGGCGCHH